MPAARRHRISKLLAVIALGATAASAMTNPGDAAERGAPGAGSGDPTLAAWRLTAKLLVNDALRTLPADSAPPPASGPARAAALTRAVLLLNAQPKTQGNLSEAARLLEGVHRARADDDPGLRALYYLGRLAQFHQNPPDLRRAAALFEKLYKLAPADPLGQAAGVQWMLLRLFELDPAPTDASTRSRLQEAEALAAILTDPDACRDLHLALADLRGILDPGDVLHILDHLLAAETAGIHGELLSAVVALRIGEFARALKRNDVATAHYRRFLTLQPHDPRREVVRQRLEELASIPPP